MTKATAPASCAFLRDVGARAHRHIFDKIKGNGVIIVYNVYTYQTLTTSRKFERPLMSTFVPETTKFEGNVPTGIPASLKNTCVVFSAIRTAPTHKHVPISDEGTMLAVAVSVTCNNCRLTAYSFCSNKSNEFAHHPAVGDGK